MIDLRPAPLTKDSFAPFGDVIELSCAQQYAINQGLTTRFHDLFDIDVTAQGGRAIVNVFRTDPLPLPHQVTVMERHPLGSQAFMPMDHDPFLVLVADAGDRISASDLHLFVTNGRQGINFYRNTWHHFQIGLGKQRDFIVIDRGGMGSNLEEINLDESVRIPADVMIGI